MKLRASRSLDGRLWWPANGRGCSPSVPRLGCVTLRAAGRCVAATTDDGGIVGQQVMADGSHRFKMRGGPFDGMVFRFYPPFDPVTFPTIPPATYGPAAPSGRSSKWVYEHHPNHTQGEP